MLLSNESLLVARFEPVLAATLGNGRGEEGCNVLAEAIARGHVVVDIEHWLYCLAKTPGTWIRKRLIDAPGQVADDFVAGIEAGLPRPNQTNQAPQLRMTLAGVSAEVRAMLERAEALTADARQPWVTDAALTSAMLEVLPARLARLLDAWASPSGMAAFRLLVKRHIRPDSVEDCFDTQGTLQRRLFLPGGRRFCDRLVEDAASLGVTRIGTRHLLYTLLGEERGLLARTLGAFGIDVKRDLHASLTREFVRPGLRRAEPLELTRATLFETVARLFEHSLALARTRDSAGIAEHDVSLAFAAKHESELARLLAGQRGVSASAVREQMESSEADPAEAVDDSPLARLPAGEIEQRINQRIFGQGAAVSRVMPWIKRLQYGIPRDSRPAAVFLFLGPTGTGKTQLAKELARYVFGDEDQCLFLEMGQFKTKESMSMFIGAPPGYVGYGDGKLTNGLRDKPQCVVLFDEIEKADTQVFDTLLRFADEGVISDPAGPVRDGRKCIIVMTTNAGQSWLRENPRALDDPGLAERLFDAAMEELSGRGFRPEFLGRVDERITFLPFSRATCRAIVDLQLAIEIGKFRRLKNVVIEVEDDACAVLATLAHARCAQEGARGVPRAINEQIVTPAIDLLTSDPSTRGMEGVRLVATALGKERVKVEVRR